MEMLMQYVWEHRLLPPTGLATVDGTRLEIIDPGLRNTDAGPDFFNAKIIIGDRLWAGNVEIHVRATDWHRHRHDTDPAYRNVVLHVVAHDDARITRADGTTIPQMVMRCSPQFRDRYLAMVHNPVAELPCAAELSTISHLHISDWISALAYERVYDKAARVTALLERLDGNWAAATYVVLARALGFSTNALPFERTAISMPLTTLLRHRDNPLSVEAMLIGTAGFLEPGAPGSAPSEPYLDRLRDEWSYMRTKYSLTALSDAGWRMARMRPPNFPHRRLATLAAMVCGGFRAGFEIFAVDSIDDARKLFATPLPEYWRTHFNFNTTSAPSQGILSDSSVDSLIINVVVPVLFAYGLAYGDNNRCARAIDLLQQLRSETNSIVSIFTRAGIESRDALTSQALIQLRRCYCEPRKCLYCRLGHRILASKVNP